MYFKKVPKSTEHFREWFIKALCCWNSTIAVRRSWQHPDIALCVVEYCDFRLWHFNQGRLRFAINQCLDKSRLCDVTQSLKKHYEWFILYKSSKYHKPSSYITTQASSGKITFYPQHTHRQDILNCQDKCVKFLVCHWGGRVNLIIT